MYSVYRVHIIYCLIIYIICTVCIRYMYSISLCTV
nr:MAG TPA: hypothetical protein [Bacteriophage sp.]